MSGLTKNSVNGIKEGQMKERNLEIEGEVLESGEGRGKLRNMWANINIRRWLW